MDGDSLERAGIAAAAAAHIDEAIDEVRVEYLGRKSELKQALREVRDRETGMALNAVRERLEAAIDAREAELARAELDERLTTERVDVTLPAGGYATRAAASDHTDPPRGRGRLSRARLQRRRRP